MNPGDMDWWWRYGLDGIVGGAIGGFVTALAVVATLRHERRMADLQEARATAAKLVAVSWKTQRALRLAKTTDSALEELPALVWELRARTATRWPEYSSLLEALFDAFVDKLGVPDVSPSDSELAGRIGAVSSEWISDSTTYEVSTLNKVRRGTRRAWSRLRPPPRV